MIRKLILYLFFLGFISEFATAQFFEKTSDLFKRSAVNSQTGHLNIIQNPAIDTLISRYILANKNAYDAVGYSGMDGFRIQIYNSNNRNARMEAPKTGADFMSKFPGIASYPLFAEPGYYKIRVGDFRTRTEATKLFLSISKEFPDAYIVPDIINFPDHIKK
jgi:hypothetical protein